MERAEVARFKFPDRVVTVDALPATKIGKKALRADIARWLDEERQKTP
ncbi:hypothetical protein AB0C84_35830 [Actinomadura sp. NPDC048955]